jgi:hypothetical protein
VYVIGNGIVVSVAMNKEGFIVRKVLEEEVRISHEGVQVFLRDDSSWNEDVCRWKRIVGKRLL